MPTPRFSVNAVVTCSMWSSKLKTKTFVTAKITEVKLLSDEFVLYTVEFPYSELHPQSDRKRLIDTNCRRMNVPPYTPDQIVTSSSSEHTTSAI